ncbi:MAG: GNAT family N-acetyltransferase [Rhodocyclales bacterium]|nr:GNAT family N-acetyltransferase [Rhodocyclales bacterium]
MPERLRVALVGFNLGGNPPLGLACLQAYAEAQPDLAERVETRLLGFDYYVAPESALAEILAGTPDLIGFNTMHGSLAHALRLAPTLRQLCPGALLVLGGIDASMAPERVLSRHPEVDAIVCGEGEIAYAELLRRLLGRQPLDDLAGLALRVDGVPRRNSPPPPLDLSQAVSPYLAGVLDPDRLGAVHLETYRGCAYRCDFCHEGRGFATVRKFPLDLVREELAFVLARSCRSIKFYDTTFNQYRERTLAILDHACRHNRRRHVLGAEVRMELFDREIALACRQANCLDIETGLQSLDEGTMQKAGRRNRLGPFERNLKDAVDLGLNVFVHVMGGLPGERLERTFAAHDWAMARGAEVCLFHTRVLPGTGLAQRARREGIAHLEEAPHDVLCHPEFSLADLARYNRFGFARMLLGPYLPLLRRLPPVGGPAPSAVIAAHAECLADEPAFAELCRRRHWWNAGTDPSLAPEMSALRGRLRCDAVARLAGHARHLDEPARAAALALLEQLRVMDELSCLPRPRAHAARRIDGRRYRLSPAARIVALAADIRALVADPRLGLGDAPPGDCILMTVRRADGSITQAINPAMGKLLESFRHPLHPAEAIEAFAGEALDADVAARLNAVIDELIAEGALVPTDDTDTLLSDANWSLRPLGVDAAADAMPVYAANPRFFRLLCGIDAPPLDYVIGDIGEAPPGYEHCKHFMGIYARDGGELIGVADILSAYPEPGRACIGLLMLAEGYQRRGVGRAVLGLLEAWARERFGVREFTVGVEECNEASRRFWRACGYSPSGERFENTALSKTHASEVLVKRVAAAG